MHESTKLKLSRLKRFKIFGNGTYVCADGNCVNFSEVHDLLRDETSGANVIVHTNKKPDGNESEKYYVVTSDQFELCFTANEWKIAAERFGSSPWLPRVKAPVSKPPVKTASKKSRKRGAKDGRTEIKPTES